MAAPFTQLAPHAIPGRRYGSFAAAQLPPPPGVRQGGRFVDTPLFLVQRAAVFIVLPTEWWLTIMASVQAAEAVRLAAPPAFTVRAGAASEAASLVDIEAPFGIVLASRMEVRAAEIVQSVGGVGKIGPVEVIWGPVHQEVMRIYRDLVGYGS